MEKDKKFFWISFLAMSVSNLIISCTNIFDFELPDFLFIALIVVTLASVFSLIYFSIRLWLGNMDNKK